MTEQTPQPEALGGTEEPQGSPIPKVSEVSAAVTPSGRQVDEDALVERLVERVLPKFEEAAKRRAQSIFDKSSYQFETMAEYLKAADGDPKKAAREMALDQVAQREMSRQSSEPEVPGRTEGEDRKERERQTQRILDEVEDETGVRLVNDDLKAIWGDKEYHNWTEPKRDAIKAAVKKLKGESIGAGAVVAEGGKTAPPQGDLAEKYKSEMLAARGQGSAVGREIKARFRSLGVDVDSINLMASPVAERDPRREKIDFTRK